MSDEFDPNNQNVPKKPNLKKDWLWATYIPDRTGKFKIHGTKGHATSAIKVKCFIYSSRSGYKVPKEVKLYKRNTVDSKWVEVPLVSFFKGDESVIK